MRLVLVMWHDAGGRSGWQKVSEAMDWATDEGNFDVTTVGFVIAESENALVLAPSVSGDKILDPIRIPQSSIDHIEDIPLGGEDA